MPDIVKQIEDECRGHHLRAHQELEKKFQEARKEVDKLTSQKCQLEEECTKLKQTLLFLQENKDPNEEEILRLRMVLTEKSRELREKEVELKDKTFECEHLRKRLAASQESLKQAEDARTELDNKTFECEHLQKRLAASKESLKEAEDARTELENKTFECEHLQKRLAASQESLKEAEDARRELENKTFECEHLQKRLAASKETLKEAEDARTELERENIRKRLADRVHARGHVGTWFDKQRERRMADKDEDSSLKRERDQNG